MVSQVSPTHSLQEPPPHLTIDRNHIPWIDPARLSEEAVHLAEQHVIAPKRKGDAGTLLKRCRVDCKALARTAKQSVDNKHRASSLKDMWLSERASDVLTLISQVQERLPAYDRDFGGGHRRLPGARLHHRADPGVRAVSRQQVRRAADRDVHRCPDLPRGACLRVRG